MTPWDAKVYGNEFGLFPHAEDLCVCGHERHGHRNCGRGACSLPHPQSLRPCGCTKFELDGEASRAAARKRAGFAA